MTLYKYRALNHEGTALEDTMEAPSAHRVVEILQERGLQVSSVDEVHPPGGILYASHRLSWGELHVFLQQLSSVVKSGLPLPGALKSLAADLRGGRLRAAIERLRVDLERGDALDEALARQSQVFPYLFVSAIKAGIASGNLAGVLQMLSHFTGRLIKLRGNLQIALAYPLTVIVAAGFIMTFLLVKVVPVYAEIFHDFGGELPWPTQFWVNISDVIVYQGAFLATCLFVLLAAGVITWRLSRRTASGRIVVDWIRLHIPMWGPIYHVVTLARFTRALGLLLTSRVPINESLELAAAAAGSPILERAIAEANLMVASGERLADALESTGYFGHTFCWMVATAEERGQVEEAFESLAETYEREVSLRDRFAVALVAPVLVVAIGILVLSLVVSLYLPIFSLGDAISR